MCKLPKSTFQVPIITNINFLLRKIVLHWQSLVMTLLHAPIEHAVLV